MKRWWIWAIVLLAIVLAYVWSTWLGVGVALLLLLGIGSRLAWETFCGLTTPQRLAAAIVALAFFWLVFFGAVLPGAAGDAPGNVSAPVEDAMKDLARTEAAEDAKVEAAGTALDLAKASAAAAKKVEEAEAELELARARGEAPEAEVALGQARRALEAAVSENQPGMTVAEAAQELETSRTDRDEAVDEKQKALDDEKAKLAYQVFRIADKVNGYSVSQKLYATLAVSLPLLVFIFGAGPLSQHGTVAGPPPEED